MGLWRKINRLLVIGSLKRALRDEQLDAEGLANTGITATSAVAIGTFSVVHQALQEMSFQQDLNAARRIYEFVTSSHPKPTLGDLWSALVSEGLMERIPLNPDVTDPALITMAVFGHLERRFHDDPTLLPMVQKMQVEVADALQYELFQATDGSWSGVQRQPLGPEEIEDVAPAAEATIDHTLARLFLRLGPPPEASARDYTPAGTGGGGAQQ